MAETSIAYMTFRRDGAWYYEWGFGPAGAAGGYGVPYNMAGGSYYVTSSYAGGYWTAAPTAAVGDGYQVQYNVSDATPGLVDSTEGTTFYTKARPGTYSISNGAASYAVINPSRVLSLTFTDDKANYTAPGGIATIVPRARFNVTAFLRHIASGQVVSGALVAFDARIQWAITAGGGGTAPGGGGGCVSTESFISSSVQAKNVVIGSKLHGMTEPGQFSELEVRGIKVTLEPCLQVFMENDANLILSEATPVYTVNKSMEKMAADLVVGDSLYCRTNGVKEVLKIREVREVGKHPVANIDLGGFSYAAGMEPNKLIYTHNSTNKN